MKKRVNLIPVLLVCALVLSLLSFGCSGKSKNSAAGEDAPAKDKIVIAMNMDPGTMNPYGGSFGPQLTLTTQAIETLFLYNQDGELVPWLVTDYIYDEGNRGITLHLRDDVYFHNGDKMTSADVLYSFEVAKKHQALSAILTAIDKDNVKAIDEYTVYVPARFPVGTIPHLLSNLFVVNKNTFEAESSASAGFTGTGPWKVTDWKAGISVSFEAFDNYWGGKPEVSELEIRIITESSIRMIELERGEVDIYRTGSTEDINRVERGDSENAKVWKADASMCIHYLGFNCSHAPFDDVKVRQALCYALDRDSVADAVFGPKGEPSTNLFPGGSWYSPDLPEELKYNYDPEKAKALLAEAGYPDGLKVSLYVDSNPSRRSIAELIPSMLAKAGVEVELVFMETAAFNAYMLSENDYDMFVWNFGNLYEPSGAMSSIRPESNKGGGSGKWHYADDPEAKKVGDILFKAMSTVEDSERAKVYYDLAVLWAENAFGFSLVDQYDVNLVNARLEGYYFSPNINVQNAYYK